MSTFPFYKQLDMMDCGPSCLRMVAKHYGKHFSLANLREKCHIDREGVSLLGISDAAERIGLHSLSAKIDYQTLVTEAPHPSIVHWKQNHFIVVYKISKNKVHVADPAHGKITYSKSEFLKGWCSNKDRETGEGVVMLLEPRPAFYEQLETFQQREGFGVLIPYLKPYKKYFFQLVLGLLLGSFLSLLFPFLTQAIVDIGINTQDVGFIYLILAAQLMLFLGKTGVEFIRSWILLHINTRLNISILSDFLVKLMRLPLGFFDKKMTGDLLQRIYDHQRIEYFLTNSSLQTLFSLTNLLVFSIVLAIYSFPILALFLIGSILHFFWVAIFMSKRREIDYKRFDQLAENQNSLIQLIRGMPDIKLNNYEKQRRWEWERIQAGLFKVNVQSLSLEQYQKAGASFFSELANILITFVAATEVIAGNITLGMMLAISYIIGQMNGPISQLMNFMKLAQDARISLERLLEIHGIEEEQKDLNGINWIPENQGFSIQNLGFRYGGPHSAKVLDGVNLEIPFNKVTAIVGTSGSGKTTLIKLLLQFYEAVEGQIKLGDTNINLVDRKVWRDKCGVVMQDGYLFSDTIAKNIALGETQINIDRLLNAVKVANIQSFIESLPLGYNTKIGEDGIGLSGGQKQRLLIARAVYKDPEYLFFDEATNALDAYNERTIMDNLNKFFEGKTVIVIAHRLSTVQNADQIVVMENGQIMELGSHSELVSKRGAYFRLVKNQLELGS